jgi:hypothetical protein
VIIYGSIAISDAKKVAHSRCVVGDLSDSDRHICR